MAFDASVDSILTRLRTALEAAGVPYMLTGSFASSLHGAPRVTHDVDVVIAPTLGSLHQLLKQFPDSEYYVSREAALQAYGAESMFNVVDFETGWKVDFIIRKSRPFSLEEFERRQAAAIDGNPIVVASAEDVVIAKLEWAKLGESERQIRDAAEQSENVRRNHNHRHVEVHRGARHPIVQQRKTLHLFVRQLQICSSGFTARIGQAPVSPLGRR